MEKFEIEDFLRNNALWVIMDPWHPTPYEQDLIKCPYIEDHNQKTLDKIIDYFSFSKVKYRCISCPEFIIEHNNCKKVFSHKKINHLFNLKNNYSNLELVMNKLNLNNIVYCGFHYGQCILHKPDGAINASKKFTTWVKKDLCCLFPEELSWEQADFNTLKYSTII
jgi:hypothetical protein